VTYDDRDDAAFASFGPLVPVADVPAKVREGLLVMSRGYGQHDPEYDDDGAVLFNAIGEDDLAAWDEDDLAAIDADWGPFRLWLCPQCDRPLRESGACSHQEEPG
jgi:hypothetical protein